MTAVLKPAAPALGTPLLRAEGLVKRYGGVVATDNVSISLQRGEVLGIIGPNGAGKSTLFGLLGGAFAPSAGSIHFNGVDITALPASERARLGIGRTYQIPRPFLDMTVRENLLTARFSLHPFESGRVSRQACDNILARVGLSDVATLQARGLPLLRRKRLEVARALALNPKLLLLDEVGAGLVDSEVTELIELIQSLRGELDGIIIIEHVLRVVRECCERLAVVNFGRKFADGTTADVLASDEVAAVYLGTAHGNAAPAATSANEAPAKPAIDLAPLVSVQPSQQAAGQPLLQLDNVHAGYGQAQRPEPHGETRPGGRHPGHQRRGQDHAGQRHQRGDQAHRRPPAGGWRRRHPAGPAPPRPPGPGAVHGRPPHLCAVVGRREPAAGRPRRGARGEGRPPRPGLPALP